MRFRRKGFTLIELLVVMGMLAVLLTAATLILNPAELNKRARDARRISDIDAVNKNIDIYDAQGGLAFGSSNTVYISLPNTLSSCSGAPTYTLPTLPSLWSYNCATVENYTKVDGNGWIPVDLASIPGISPPKLPIDPINSDTGNRYYTYIGGSWELSASMESSKHLQTASQDGGDSLSYEAGTNLSLSPILKASFNMDSFSTTIGSNQPAWKRLAGTGSISLGSDSEGGYGRGASYVWYEYQENVPFNPNAKYKLSCRVRQVADPTNAPINGTDGKRIYCGVSGVGADGVTYVNASGSNSSGGQHYFAASFDSLTAGAGYTTFTGYFKGHGTPAGGKRVDPNNPGKMYPGVAYIRPMFILNYSGGNGTADIDFEMLEVIE